VHAWERRYGGFSGGDLGCVGCEPLVLTVSLPTIGTFTIWQSELERRALPYLRLGPHTSAVSLDDPFHYGEPHSRALELVLTVQALEQSE